MLKRPLSSGGAASASNAKRSRTAQVVYKKIASAKDAAAVDKNPPLLALEDRMKAIKDASKGHSVVYWMRMEDMRVVDNRALAKASETAQQLKLPLLTLFVISPGDYSAHDRSSRRIDFMLRNLQIIKELLSERNIPVHCFTHSPRKTLPAKVISFLEEYKANHLFANIEYEVDELRRDIETFDCGQSNGMRVEFLHDKLVVNPGLLKSKQGKDYAVYTPWQKAWLGALNSNLKWLEEAPEPKANAPAIRENDLLSKLFESSIPASVPGFECMDKEKMEMLWPAGTSDAMQLLDRFLHTKSRASQVGDSPPLADGSERSEKNSRIQEYVNGRNRCDMDTSSRLSPYLASGVISARECIRRTMKFLNRKTVEGTRENTVGMWVQEVAWRDFYHHIMTAFPRVSMGRPYLEKFADVKWEVNEEHLQAWKDGKTGVPIVDAAMRQAKTQGWMHNRARMIAAMFLTKDLMLDWRLGEKHFMELFIDGDLAANNGGWQWSASTGTDPQPYFRIFNPYSQSEKADPTGNYIRHFVPELRNLKGKVVHNPIEVMPKFEFKKLGYPEPLVDHKKARERALRRYKNPGEE